MQSSKDTEGTAPQEYSQFLRFQGRILTQLERIAEELEAPGTKGLAREVRRRTGDPEHSLTEVVAAVQEAIRSLKVSESELRLALISHAGELQLDGVSNLPASLARFLAERKQLPGFSFEVTQDEVRGWVVRWKELTSSGTIRGFGQFYERPYAWLDE